MAIRDHFRRRKSISEPSQGNGGITSPESKSPALRLAKTLGWLSTKEEKPKKKAAKDEIEKADPRERPFSETNLRHQEILNGFTLTFGKRHPSRDQTRDQTRSSYYSIGVSPGTSRHNSVDDSPRRMNSVAMAREGPFVRSVPEEDERP